MNIPASNCELCNAQGGVLVWRNDDLRVVCVDDSDLPGYTRVIWQAHVAEMTDLGTRERDELMQAVFFVENVQRQILQADKVNLAALGNMTPHLHWHVIPRWRDDPWFPESIWGQRQDASVPAKAGWPERRSDLAALQEEYKAALRASLELL